MKTNLITISILFACGIIFGFSTDAQTNGQYSADLPTNIFSLGPNGFRDFSGQEEPYYVRSRYQHISVLPEMLPANEDTNDIWGVETNGLQLSIRFRDTKYRIGDIIPAITILRNLESNPRTLLLTNSPSFFLTFMVQCGTNGYLPERKRETSLPRSANEFRLSPPQGFLSWSWDPRSEKEIVIDLNTIFEFNQPGEYTAKVICRVYSPATKLPLYEVSSGTTSFQLVAKPSAVP